MPFNTVMSKEDLLRGTLCNVGWHPAEFVDYDEETAKTDGSTNLLLYFKILDGPNKGIKVQVRFNEKVLGFGKALWKLWGFAIDKEGNLALNDQMIKAKINSKLQIYVQHGESNKGNKFNEVKDYRPL